jgi:hypothetical protein
MPFISAPIPHAASMVSLSPQWSPKHQHQHQQEQRQTPPSSAASDSNSSVSTPISAVTAPQSQAASLRSLPPVLDTPIEGASFGFDIGFGMGLTPAPANAGSSTSTDAPLNNSRSHTPPPLNLPVIHPLSFTHRTTTARAMKSGGNYSHIRSQASSSNLSIASTASSNHLSLFEDEDDDEGMEEWTQSVLLAADVDVEAVQKAP